MLKLYCAPKSISIATVMALYDAGIHWEPIRVDMVDGEQTREPFLSLNPKGRVPVLITPEGSLTETGAILEYLAETAMPGYVPADPLARGRMREVMFYIASTLHVNHAHMMRGYRWADQESSLADMTAKVPETMTASAAYIEDLITGPYFLGTTPTIADFYLFASCLWFERDGVEVANFPKIIAFMETMEETRGVREARANGFIL